MEDGANKPKKKKWLVSVFVALSLIIVGVVVFLIITKVIPFSDGQTSNSESSAPLMHSEDMDELNRKARKMDFDSAKELYEQTIESIESEPEKSESRIEYGKFLLFYDEDDLAIGQFNRVDETVLDSGYKILYYVGLRDYYESINDEVLYEDYNNKVREAITNSDYASGG